MSGTEWRPNQDYEIPLPSGVMQLRPVFGVVQSVILPKGQCRERNSQMPPARDQGGVTFPLSHFARSCCQATISHTIKITDKNNKIRMIERGIATGYYSPLCFVRRGKK